MLSKVPPLEMVTACPSRSVASPGPKVMLPVEAAPAAFRTRVPASRVRPPVKLLAAPRVKVPPTSTLTEPAPLIEADRLDEPASAKTAAPASVMAPASWLTSPPNTTVPALIVVAPVQSAAALITKVSPAPWLMVTEPEPETGALRTWVAPKVPAVMPRVSSGVPAASDRTMSVLGEASCRWPSPLIEAVTPCTFAALIALTRSESRPVPPTTMVWPSRSMASLACIMGDGRTPVTEMLAVPEADAAPNFSRNRPPWSAIR